MLPGLIQVVGGMVQSGYTPTGVEVTPTMTSNTAPSGYTASGSTIGAGAYWNCFDKNSGQDYGCLWSPPGTAATIQLLLPSTVWLASYSLQFRTGAAGDAQWPKDWTFQYTTDGGGSWATADTRTGASSWSADEIRTFTIATPVQGNGFKVVGTANGGSGNWYALKEVRVYS